MSENDVLIRIGTIQGLITEIVASRSRSERQILANKTDEAIKSLINELANDYERFRHQIEVLKGKVDELRSEEDE